jgi:hypothetical protein
MRVSKKSLLGNPPRENTVKLPRIFRCILIVCLLAAPSAWSQSLPIPQILGAVHMDSLRNTVRILSGDTTVQMGASTHLIANRTDTTNRKLARRYLYEKLLGLGLPTRLDSFISNPWSIADANIIAEQRGTLRPDIKVIICAYYWSWGSSGSPGADANGSGCAAVLEAARILSRYATGYTVVYALWDQPAKQGSWLYANAARLRGDSILGVINLDQLGYDKVNSHSSTIVFQPFAQSEPLADSLVALSKRYAFDSLAVSKYFWPLSSDQQSFYQKNYTAVLLTEDVQGGINPNTESLKDTIGNFNLRTFRNRAMLAIAGIAWLAQTGDPLLVEGTARQPEVIKLHQNYPNPFNPSTTIRYDLPQRSRVSLTVFNALGQQVSTLVQGEQNAGYHEVRLDASGMASGVYFYRMQAGAYVETRKLLLLR